MFKLLCLFYERYTAPFVDGSLSQVNPFLEQSLRGHIAGCKSCSKAVEDYRTTHSQMRLHILAAKVTNSFDPQSIQRGSLADRVELRIAMTDQVQLKRQGLVIRLALTACALALVVILVTSPILARQWVAHHIQPEPSSATTALQYGALSATSNANDSSNSPTEALANMQDQHNSNSVSATQNSSSFHTAVQLDQARLRNRNVRLRLANSVRYQHYARVDDSGLGAPIKVNMTRQSDSSHGGTNDNIDSSTGQDASSDTSTHVGIKFADSTAMK